MDGIEAEELAAEDRGEASGGGVTWVALEFFLGALHFGEVVFVDERGVGFVGGASGETLLGVADGGIPESAYGSGSDVEFGGFVVGPEGDAGDGEIGFPLGGFFFALGDDDLDIASGAGGFGGGEGAVFEEVEPADGHGDAAGGEIGDGEAFDIGLAVLIEGELGDGGAGGFIGDHLEVIAVEDGVDEEGFLFGGVEGIGFGEIGDWGVEIGVEVGLRLPGIGAGGWREIGGEGGVKAPVFDEGIGGVKFVGFGGFA